MIALPCGAHADRLKNVLASGPPPSSTKGTPTRLDQPEIVPIEGDAARSLAKDQRSLRFFRVDRCLRVRRIEPEEAAEELTDPQ